MKYNFPAIRGFQARKEYFICMAELGLLSKIFIVDDEETPPEYRAQRRLNEIRIPKIKDYILSNRDAYVFSALAASIDGEMVFKPSAEYSQLGELQIDMNATFLINDGQHRKAAIIQAIKADHTLSKETIAVVLYKDQGLQRSEQMFTDLNKHTVTTSKFFA